MAYVEGECVRTKYALLSYSVACRKVLAELDYITQASLILHVEV